MPSGLKILGELAKFGYKKFQPKQPFLKSSLAYRPATISNFPNEPKIYSFLNKENEAFFMWSFIYDQLKIENDWFEDSIQFSRNYFYRNSDSFLNPEVDSFKELN